jgi:hypothetical protein
VVSGRRGQVFRPPGLTGLRLHRAEWLSHLAG